MLLRVKKVYNITCFNVFIEIKNVVSNTKILHKRDYIMKAYIYTLTNTVTQRIYIGVTRNIQQRFKTWHGHLKSDKVNKYPSIEFIKQDFKSVSSDILSILEFDILEVCEEEDMFIVEAKHILAYSKTHYLYNIQIGDEAGLNRRNAVKKYQDTKIKKERIKRVPVIKIVSTPIKETSDHYIAFNVRTGERKKIYPGVTVMYPSI